MSPGDIFYKICSHVLTNHLVVLKNFFPCWYLHSKPSMSSLLHIFHNRFSEPEFVSVYKPRNRFRGFGLRSLPNFVYLLSSPQGWSNKLVFKHLRETSSSFSAKICFLYSKNCANVFNLGRFQANREFSAVHVFAFFIKVFGKKTQFYFAKLKRGISLQPQLPPSTPHVRSMIIRAWMPWTDW
jgi:hypothetical protein